MITIRALKSAGPIALAALIALFTVAVAQETKQKAPPKPKATKTAPAKEKAPPKESAKEKAPPKETKKPAPKAAPGGGQPTLLGQFDQWGAYTATAGGKKVCYALAKPSSSSTEPAGRPRDPAYMFISTRPAENVRNEVSLVIGYPFKSGTEATVDLGSAKYALYTQGDGAWIKNAAEEARMVDAMRRATEMIVTGESGRGTKSTDRYALRGLAPALDRVAAECK
jgi:hypothetical protein